ncbi:NUDIX domain-containing protein [Microbacteriaceae bacterium 4G12]
MEKEWLTIYDEKGHVLGKKLRDDIHRDGDWHETFHCWLIECSEEKQYIYFQLRSYDKKDFPGRYDITAAGHISYKEPVLAGGVREIEEELGVNVKPEELIYAGCYRYEHESLAFIDREFCHTYFLLVSEERKLSPGDEVEHVIKVELTSFQELLDQTVSSINAIILAEEKKISVTIEQLYPYDQDYYHFILKHAKRIFIEYLQKV